MTHANLAMRISKLVTSRAFQGVIVLVSAAMPAAAHATSFFEGKNISLVVGSAAGGSYDLYARLISRHYGRHIPGHPNVSVRNMPGANSLSMATFLQDVANPDGLTLGAPLNTLPLTQMIAAGKVRVDAAGFNWIGTLSSLTSVLATWHTTGVRTVDDAKTRTVLIGSTTPGTTLEMYPLISNHVLGTKFQVVSGYKGGAAINFAMERGEVDGRGAFSYVALSFQHPDWVREGKLNYLFQMTSKRDPMLPNTPTLLELADEGDSKQIVSILVAIETIGRSLMSPPSTPSDRVVVLREGLMKLANDPQFLKDAERAKLEIKPTSGENLQRLVGDLVSLPAHVVKKYSDAVSGR